jgi:hypothetical protein
MAAQTGGTERRDLTVLLPELHLVVRVAARTA